MTNLKLRVTAMHVKAAQERNDGNCAIALAMNSKLKIPYAGDVVGRSLVVKNRSDGKKRAVYSMPLAVALFLQSFLISKEGEPFSFTVECLDTDERFWHYHGQGQK